MREIVYEPIIVIGGIFIMLSPLFAEPLSDYLREKKAIRKIKNTFEVFPSRKWDRRKRKTAIDDRNRETKINMLLYQYVKRGIQMTEEEIHAINQKIVALKEIAEKKLPGAKSMEALQSEIRIFENHLKKGTYLKNHQIVKEKEIEEIEIKIPPKTEKEYDYELSWVINSCIIDYPKTKNNELIKMAKQVVNLKKDNYLKSELKVRLKRIESQLVVILKDKLKEWEENESKQDEIVAQKIKERIKQAEETL